MNALLISIAVATLGIDYGWQRLPEGGMQYIIQLNPQALEALRAGQPIESDIPAGAGEVRSYRIIVGRGALPHDLPPPHLAISETTAAQRPALLVPPSLAPAQGVKPSSGQPAIFEEPEGKPVAGKPQPQAANSPAPQEPAKPWLPLTLTLFGLFGSLGANVYLSWLIVEFRRRFRAQCIAAPCASPSGQG